MKHELKTEPDFFKVSWAGHKSFEIRNNDRKFKLYDEIVLQEWEPAENEINDGVAQYTGREIEGVIDYITNFHQRDGYVVFSYEEKFRRE